MRNIEIIKQSKAWDEVLEKARKRMVNDGYVSLFVNKNQFINCVENQNIPILLYGFTKPTGTSYIELLFDKDNVEVQNVAEIIKAVTVDSEWGIPKVRVYANYYAYKALTLGDERLGPITWVALTGPDGYRHESTPYEYILPITGFINVDMMGVSDSGVYEIQFDPNGCNYVPIDDYIIPSSIKDTVRDKIDRSPETAREEFETWLDKGSWAYVAAYAECMVEDGKHLHEEGTIEEPATETTNETDDMMEKLQQLLDEGARIYVIAYLSEDGEVLYKSGHSTVASIRNDGVYNKVTEAVSVDQIEQIFSDGRVLIKPFKK